MGVKWNQFNTLCHIHPRPYQTLYYTTKGHLSPTTPTWGWSNRFYWWRIRIINYYYCIPWTKLNIVLIIEKIYIFWHRKQLFPSSVVMMVNYEYMADKKNKKACKNTSLPRIYLVPEQPLGNGVLQKHWNVQTFLFSHFFSSGCVKFSRCYFHPETSRYVKQKLNWYVVSR